ncbi:hypothetical protein, partial [Xanthomonas citri]|uniref:hypothetical protein n=1 Tax=Xanthomonas citri TaxID=346 RepID=UPI0011AEFEB5
ATALQLEQVLREREGIRAAVFHEGMSIIERDPGSIQVALFGEMCAEPLFVYFSKYIQICIRS